MTIIYLYKLLLNIMTRVFLSVQMMCSHAYQLKESPPTCLAEQKKSCLLPVR